MKNKYIKLKKKGTFSKTSQNSSKVFNYSLAILKVFLAFLVVVAHNFNRNSTKNETIIFITINRKLHVPSFYIMSFYFMATHLFSLNIKILLKRLIRLLIPYIGWPIILYKINRYLNLHYHKNFPDSNEELKMQLMFGNRFDHPFWFQLDMMIITVAFYIIIFIFRKFSLFILEILIILIYSVQYSGINCALYFEKYLGRDSYLVIFLLDSIPYAIVGFILGFYKVLDIIEKHKIKTLVLSFLVFKLIADYNVFRLITISPYPGVHLNIQSICLIFMFSLFPSRYITNQYIKKFLHFLTSYTAGVFYLHVPIHAYFRDYSYNIKNGTFTGMIQEYLICYFICFVGMSIFGSTPLKYMFS